MGSHGKKEKEKGSTFVTAAPEPQQQSAHDDTKEWAKLNHGG
jgi:hypothetical protein